jgi:hypothetical protein
MKPGQRLQRLERYCEEVAEFYPVRCEVHVEPGTEAQDSDWAWIVAYDLSSHNGNTKTATSPPSPAVNCLEAWLDDKMIEWFGKKEQVV